MSPTSKSDTLRSKLKLLMDLDNWMDDFVYALIKSSMLLEISRGQVWLG